MSASDPNTFDDPALKTAMRTAFGREKAPAALVEKVRQQLAANAGTFAGGQIARRIGAAPSEEMPPRRPMFRAMPFYGWLAAAMVLMGVALIGLQLKTSPKTLAASTPLPQSLAAALVQRHDSCCRPGNPHRGTDPITKKPIPQKDFVAMERVFHPMLNCRVMMADLRPDGWKFRGAAECRVGSTEGSPESAHLVFDRDGGSISIFSLRASAFPQAHDGERFATVYKNHPIVGIVANGAIFCMVQSQPGQTPSLEHLQQLFDEHESESSVAFAPRNFPTGDDPPAQARQTGELMHSVLRESLAQR